jgi:collagenase-like PrtC family protease
MAKRTRSDTNFLAIAAELTKIDGQAHTADEIRNFFRAWRAVRDNQVAADLAELEQLREEKRQRELGLKVTHGGQMTTFERKPKA